MATTVEASATAVTATAGAWYRDRQRLFVTGGIGLLLAAAVTYFVIESGNRKEQFAAQSLSQAQAAADAGNLPLASTELQKLIGTYKGTEAAAEAVLELNQIRLYNDQAELAAAGLREFLASNPNARYKVPATGLLGGALESAKHWAQAGDAYTQAAQLADNDNLKAAYLASAGRAYRMGGMTEKAIQAYRTVIERYGKASNIVEAQLRLAELTGGKQGELPSGATRN